MGNDAGALIKRGQTWSFGCLFVCGVKISQRIEPVVEGVVEVVAVLGEIDCGQAVVVGFKSQITSAATLRVASHHIFSATANRVQRQDCLCDDGAQFNCVLCEADCGGERVDGESDADSKEDNSDDCVHRLDVDLCGR
jgi:hypothetical protein